MCVVDLAGSWQHLACLGGVGQESGCRDESRRLEPKFRSSWFSARCVHALLASLCLARLRLRLTSLTYTRCPRTQPAWLPALSCATRLPHPHGLPHRRRATGCYEGLLASNPSSLPHPQQTPTTSIFIAFPACPLPRAGLASLLPALAPPNTTPCRGGGTTASDHSLPHSCTHTHTHTHTYTTTAQALGSD